MSPKMKYSTFSQMSFFGLEIWIYNVDFAIGNIKFQIRMLVNTNSTSMEGIIWLNNVESCEYECRYNHEEHDPTYWPLADCPL